MDLDIVRALPPDGSLLRAAAGDDDGLGLLYGHFSVFNRWYEVHSWWEGDFLERIASGAFATTIAEDRASMKVLYDHGYDPQLGNKVLGPIRDLREDGTGPYYEVPLFDTTYTRDLLPGLAAGVYGASFRFRVTAESWDEEPGTSDHNPKGLPERTITATRVFEFGPVTFPASPAATAGIRSMTDEFYESMRRTQPDRHAELVARADQLRTPPGRAGARSAAGGKGDETPRTGASRAARARALTLLTRS